MNEIDEQKARIEAIIGKTGEETVVTEETLAKYLAYLKEQIKLPCELTGIEAFEWEEYYPEGHGSKKEYEKLKKIQPSFIHKFKLLSIIDEVNEEDGITAEVRRIADKKKFTLPLADLETTAKNSANYQLLNDYSVWFVNNRPEMPDEDYDDDDDELFEEHVARIEAIIGGSDEELEVTEETLKTYLAYLKEHIELPCELTGMYNFDWEEYYVFGTGSKKEYEHLKKTNPSFTDNFDLLSFIEADDEDIAIEEDGIMANVRRISDKKEFTLPLSELEATDESSANYQLLEDYYIWFINN